MPDKHTKIHRPSIVGFKKPWADLHRLSRWIFGVSLILAATVMGVILTTTWQAETEPESDPPPQPVVIQIENIPETRHRVQAPAPELAMPLEVDDDFIPDDITIESTELDMAEISTPAPPPDVEIVAPAGDVEEVEQEIFEYFSVEEKPSRTTTVVPEYPRMAERARIEGAVYLKLLVNTEGAVDSVMVIKGDEIFHDASIEAAKKTRFSPAKHNDKPVACWVILPFTFKLDY